MINDIMISVSLSSVHVMEQVCFLFHSCGPICVSRALSSYLNKHKTEELITVRRNCTQTSERLFRVLI